MYMSVTVLYMSQVPPVCHAVVTVSIGLKNMLRVGTSVPYLKLSFPSLPMQAR